MSTTSRFRAAQRVLDRAGLHLPGCIEHVEDEAEDLRAQTFDPIGRSNVSSILYCPEHHQDLADCHRDELTCTVAEPVAVHNDPTGEAAIEPSGARRKLAEVDAKVHALEKLARWFDDFTFDNTPRNPRTANPVESRKAQQENAKPAGCQLCAVVDRWSSPHTAKPTDVGGVLDDALLVCEPHYDFIRTRNRLPTGEEDRYYARKGKWPKVKQTDRLARGLHVGSLS